MRRLSCTLCSALMLAACAHQTPRAPYVVAPTAKPAATTKPNPAPSSARTVHAGPAPVAAPAITPTPSPAPVTEAVAPLPPQPPRQLADGAQVPAVQGLMGAADRALGKGDVELAAVDLERAQRLAPQSAAVYQRLARVRLQQNRPAEAEQLARKALAYAASFAQQAELWHLIASARQQQGQTAAAQEAKERAAALESAAVGSTP